MSLILSLPVAPQAATARANSQAGRSDNQNKNDQNSFSAVFKRSQTSAEKAPEKTAVQRHRQNQNDSDKTSEPADPAAALALAFIALEPRLAAVFAGTAASAAPSGPASTVAAALGADANLSVAQLALAIPGPQNGDAPDLLSDAKATGNTAIGTGTSAGLRTPQLAALTTPAPQDGDAPDLLSDAKATGNATTATTTAEISAGLRTPQLAATDRVELTQVALPAKSAAANMSTTAAGVIANQAMMSDTGATGQQSKQDETATDSRDGKFNVKSDWRIEAPMAASIAEATAATVAATKGNSVPAADQLDLSMATPNNPANVLPQLPAGAIQQTAAAAAAAAPVNLPLAPPVGSSEWADALGKQVAWMGNTNNQVAELQLNPAGLGPLKITLTINNHQAEALFVAAHPSVRAAVEAALPQLRSNLADNGISLGNTSVSADTQQQNAFAQGRDNQSSQPKYRADSVSTSNQGANLSMPEAAATVSGNRNNVDIFA